MSIDRPAVDVLARARQLADELLRPNAEHIDQTEVPESHIRALASIGLLGLLAPKSMGGLEATDAETRELAEILAGADLTTTFVLWQHFTALDLSLGNPETEASTRWLGPIASGEALAGVAFSHLRRPGPPPVKATRVGDGWRIDGRLDWLTSWRLAAVFAVAAVDDQDRIVWVMTDLRSPAVRTSPLALAAVAGSRTVSAVIDGLEVGDESVISIRSRTDWQAANTLRVANVNPSVIGICREAIDRLRLGGDDAAFRFAAAAESRLDLLRGTAYGLMSDHPPDRFIDERRRLRADIHELSLRVTAGLVTAGAGRSMSLDNAGQRLAREALFMTVQGQDAPARLAILDRLSG